MSGVDPVIASELEAINRAADDGDTRPVTHGDNGA